VAKVSLQAGRPSGDSTISVRALKETQSTDLNQWPDLILPSYTTGLQTKAVAPLWPGLILSSYTTGVLTEGRCSLVA